jgi:hypothetical protein
VHDECESSWKGELPKETIGHIQSVGCLGQKEVVIAAHNACTRELLQEVNVHGKVDKHMRLFTIEAEIRLGSPWDQEGCDDDDEMNFARRKNSFEQNSFHHQGRIPQLWESILLEGILPLIPTVVGISER